MIELIFVACLRTSPDLCEQRSIAYLQDVGLLGCLMRAQPELAEWSLAHPMLQVARWSCQYSGEKELDA